MASSKKAHARRRLQEASSVLKAMGLPPAQCNERSALTLLALAALEPVTPWAAAQQPLLRVHDMMAFMLAAYGKKYAENSRETIRRQTLHQFIDARIADKNPDDPGRATNSGNNAYALSTAALEVVRKVGAPEFGDALTSFLAQHGTLTASYRGPRELIRVPITLPEGKQIAMSSGAHNLLQKAVIEEFAPRFAQGAKVLYVGDTAKKDVVRDDEALLDLGVRLTKHDKLPDIILHRTDTGWLYFIEAVTSHGPITPTRLGQLQTLMTRTSAGVVFVTAFLDRAEFKKNVADIAWETEVWIAEEPDHLIHFNGHRFLGPYQQGAS